MAKPENTTPEVEARNHRYRGNVIPWYVRVGWLGFWILCIAYIFTWLVPALKKEILNPP
jgi:hypothetical protein